MLPRKGHLVSRSPQQTSRRPAPGPSSQQLEGHVCLSVAPGASPAAQPVAWLSPSAWLPLRSLAHTTRHKTPRCQSTQGAAHKSAEGTTSPSRTHSTDLQNVPEQTGMDPSSQKAREVPLVSLVLVVGFAVLDIYNDLNSDMDL
jgi:hypothetical protein